MTSIEVENTFVETDALLSKFYTFLNSIGIKVIEREFNETSFLPGLKIENGCLIVDRKQLLYPGDILHEAGHIAVAPEIERSVLNDNVTVNRPGKEGEEMAVILWSYAACLHLKINPEIVFHKEGYKGQNDWLLEKFNGQNYIGLPLLIWMGLTEDVTNENGFPKMTKWLRD